jgi:alpha-L-fucosidase 2
MAGPVAGTEVTGQAPPPDEPLSLWYRRPAAQWTEALPIGNGRLGAMVFGQIEDERIQLNEDTIWCGAPHDCSNPELFKVLPEARRLIFQGKTVEASKLLESKATANPNRQMPYELVGDLYLRFAKQPQVANYRRDLNLDSAVATVRYTAGGVTYTREAFASPVDQVIVMRLTADRPGQIAFVASLRRWVNAAVETEGSDTLVMRGSNAGYKVSTGAIKFQARVRVVAIGGKTSAKDREVSVTGADSAVLLVAAATNYKTYEDLSANPELLTKARLAAAGKKTFDALRQDHVAEHRRLFRRVALDLGTTPAAAQPTDERLKHYTATSDPQFAALYFQYGRYLLISCSRAGGQPANLQGLWNDSTSPYWDSNFMIDINTEMNYWPAEPANLGECMEPLVVLVTDLSRAGQRTAKANWGARGWVCHVATDLWRTTSPFVGGGFVPWPTGGAWLLQNVWDHYQYNPDPKFLARIYPAFKGASEFFLDTLVEEPRHKWLVTCPSLSPENWHPKGMCACAGPTIDMQIVRDVFDHTIRAAEVLGVDPELRRQVAAARARLAPHQIGKAGQLQEWLDDWDMEAADRCHRHLSHLYGLYPSDQISLRGTPELARAARKSLELRGDEGAGFALAWRMNLWARLGEGDHACNLLGMLLRPGSAFPNLLNAYAIVQIDGNFGSTAGMAEMLLQSGAGEIELLPALPKAWPSGSVRGLRARGGFEVDVTWKDGKLLSAKVRSLAGQPCLLRYGPATRQLSLKPGEEMRWDGR